MSQRDTEHGSIRELIEACYDELKQQARYKMLRERKNHSWTGTELVHQLVARLLTSKSKLSLDRKVFFPCAAVAMNNLLIDHARHRKAGRRGQDRREEFPLEIFSEERSPEKWDDGDWLDFDSFCQEMSVKYPRAVEVFRMRFFGWQNNEVAEFFDINTSTATRDFNKMKVFFRLKFGPDFEE